MLGKIGFRFFNSAAAEKHFISESLGKGVVLFTMNRAPSRNALGKLLIDQF